MGKRNQAEHAVASPYAAPKGIPEEDDDYEEDVYLLHNLAEKGRVDRLCALLPLPSEHAETPSRLSVLSSETSLLEKDDMGFLPLHMAVIHQQMDCALHLLRYSSALTSAMLRLKCGDFGTPFLHLVLRVGAINASFSERLINELFADTTVEEDFYGDDVRALLFEKMTAKDEEGNSVFHLCARYNLVKCMDELIAFYRRQLTAMEADKSAIVDGKENKKTKKAMKLEIVLEKGNKLGFRPLHEAMNKETGGQVHGRCESRHVTSLQQTPAHIAALVNFAEGVEILCNSSQHVATHLTLKDRYGYTAAQVARKCAWVASKNYGTSHDQLLSPPESTLASSGGDTDECHATFPLDLDTTLSVHSFDAAARAAGAVCKAVDEVVAGKCKNAFCIVRPPGHHAGPVGKVVCENDPEGSLGFCLFNNVAIGAAYARAHLKHRGINKVAILDFDVHHGNGTEEIVRQLVPSTKDIPFETPYRGGKQTVHQYKPWRSDKDLDNVFFCSVHGYGHKDPANKEEIAQGETQGWFYPGSGSSNVKETPLIWNEGLSYCHEGVSASRLNWRSAFRDRILPKLRDFNPDLIFLSAGFDAHKELVNWGYVSLLEQDYEWLVGHVKQVANTCCDGRVISVLEGGYNFHGRMVSPFARSVAAHTRALVNPAQEQWDEEEIAKEAAHERTLLATYLTPVASVTVLPTKKRAKPTVSLSQSRSKRTKKDVDYVALAKKLSPQP